MRFLSSLTKTRFYLVTWNSLSLVRRFNHLWHCRWERISGKQSSGFTGACSLGEEDILGCYGYIQNSVSERLYEKKHSIVLLHGSHRYCNAIHHILEYSDYGNHKPRTSPVLRAQRPLLARSISWREVRGDNKLDQPEHYRWGIRAYQAYHEQRHPTWSRVSKIGPWEFHDQPFLKTTPTRRVLVTMLSWRSPWWRRPAWQKRRVSPVILIGRAKVSCSSA